MGEQNEQRVIGSEQDNRIEKAKQKRAQSYFDVISSAGEIDTRTRERQLAVFKELPDIAKYSRFVKAELKACHAEYQNNKITDSLIIQGIIFEELVKIENNLFNLSSEETTPKTMIEKFEDIEKGNVEASIDEQLTMLFHNPNRFAYNEIEHLRNPDISFIEIDQDGNKVKVVGVGEAKSGNKLDRRCLSQFSEFYDSINKVASFINNREDCDQHGLKRFGRGEDKTKIEVTNINKFGRYLIITRDNNLDPNNPSSNFKTSGENALSEKETEIFTKYFKEGRIKVRRSSFSHTEIELLVKKIEDRINDDLKLEELEFWAEQQAV